MKKGGWGKRRVRGEMNKLEAEYAAMLDADPEVIWWAFESIKIKMTDNTYAEPDFIVQKRDRELQLHEVKGGFFPEKNKLKSKMLAAFFPMRYILCQKKNKATGWVFTEF